MGLQKELQAYQTFKKKEIISLKFFFQKIITNQVNKSKM